MIALQTQLDEQAVLSSALIDILSQTLSRGSDGADDALKNTMLGLAWLGLAWLWFVPVGKIISS